MEHVDDAAPDNIEHFQRSGGRPELMPHANPGHIHFWLAPQPEPRAWSAAVGAADTCNVYTIRAFFGDPDATLPYWMKGKKKSTSNACCNNLASTTLREPKTCCCTDFRPENHLSISSLMAVNACSACSWSPLIFGAGNWATASLRRYPPEAIALGVPNAWANSIA